jgi:hypothetical protein
MDALYRKHRDLTTAEPAELLVYALSLDPDEPVLGAVTAVQQELKLISNLMIMAPPVMEVGGSELSATIEHLARRLDAACELMRRAQRANVVGTVSETSKADLPGKP